MGIIWSLLRMRALSCYARQHEASRPAWNPRQHVCSKAASHSSLTSARAFETPTRASAVSARCSRDAPRREHSRAWRPDRHLARSPAYLAKCCNSTSTAGTYPCLELGSSWWHGYLKPTSGSGHVAPSLGQLRCDVTRMPRPWGGDSCSPRP